MTATQPPPPAGMVAPGADGRGRFGPPPVRMTPRRRRPGLAALGLVLVVLGAVGGYWLVSTVAATERYLAVDRPVAVGARLAAADLRVVAADPGPDLAPVPAADRLRVLGRYARVDLVPGTLLTTAQLTDEAVPGPGEQLVGVELKPAQLPARSLRPGDRVLLVVTPDPRALGDEGKAPAVPQTVAARVVGVGSARSDGQVVVDVVVATGDGPLVVSLAAQGRLALALVPRSGP